MVKLIIEDDEGKTTVVPLIRDEITIGRKEGNTIRLTERNVSRRHAKLLKQNGAIFIEDLSSYNGIKVNGNKIAGRVAVAEGDRIQIGDYVLGLKLEAILAAEDPFAAATKTVDLPDRSEGVDEVETGIIDLRAEDKAPPESPKSKAAEAPKADISTSRQAQLVCVSTNFASEKWSLSKSTMVLGRTEDNDVVINHRSISRHHARIVEENGRYTIIDLQSANGIRVNGEEYGKVELRRGDLIDLGHVRLRFVAPGEDFVFARDATIVDISGQSGPSHGLIWAAVSVVAIAGIGFLIYKVGFSSSSTQGNSATMKPDSRAAVASAEARSTAAPAVDPAQLHAKITEAINAEQWGEALKSCDKLASETDRQISKPSCEKAKIEKEAQSTFEKALSAATRNDYLEALQSHSKIPAGSVYKSRDPQVFGEAKSKYLAQAQKDLDDHVKQGQCEKAVALATQIKEIDPADAGSEKKAQGCSTTVAVAVKETPTPHKGEKIPKGKREPRERVTEKPTPPNPAQAAEKAAQADKLAAQASQLYVSGDHSQAITLARQAVKLVPSHKLAIKIIGASSCLMKKLSDVMWAYERLPPTERSLLKQVCGRNGLNL